MREGRFELVWEGGGGKMVLARCLGFSLLWVGWMALWKGGGVMGFWGKVWWALLSVPT
jgi:hypothetical protein